jgi:predicted nucleotidyltransferase
VFYLELFRALEREQVRYLLVGGVAVNLHGAERMTMDVDLMLGLDQENLARFLRAARTLGLRPGVLPVTLEQLCDAATVESWIRDMRMVALQLRGPQLEAPSVDILVRPAVPFEEAYARRNRIAVEDVTISVAAIADIVTLKSGTGRKVDESDIRALHRIEMLRSRRRDD